MLIVFPLGLFISAVVFDIIYLITGNENLNIVSFWNITGGVVMGLVAAVFGFIDYTHIPRDTRAKRIGLIHGLANVVVTTLFFISWLIRLNQENYTPDTFALLLSFLGMAVGAVSGWLGGELVDRLGVGVDRGAHLNAPNSLSGQPADATAHMSTHVPAAGSAIPVTGPKADVGESIDPNFRPRDHVQEPPYDRPQDRMDDRPFDSTLGPSDRPFGASQGRTDEPPYDPDRGNRDLP